MSSIKLKQRTGSIKLKQRSGRMKLKQRTGRIELDPPNFDEKLLKQGLVAYYPFDGDVNDHSGNGNHGTIYADPNFVEGISGQALDFDGEESYVENLTKVETVYSLSFWIKISASINRNPIWSWDRVGGNHSYDYRIFLDNGNKVVSKWDNDTYDAVEVASVDSVTIGGWNHIVITQGKNSHKIYINGSRQIKANIASNLSGEQRAVVGKTYVGTPVGIDLYFRGIIDNVRMYNRALSYLEIQKLYDLKM